MAQLEYGDYYKFVASAGIALIAAAVVLPWMFLREPFDLAVEASKIALLTPDAQNVLRERQHLIALIIIWIPGVSIGLGSVGVLMTGLGLFKWHQRQSIRDKGEDLGVEKLTRELEQMSPEEITAKAREDLESADEETPPVSTSDATSSVATYLASEGALLQRIRECFGDSVKVEYNQRLANVEYDAILRVRSSERIVLEIKYIRKGFHQGWLTESMNNLAAKVALYSKTFSHPSRGVLLIILANPDRSLNDRAIILSDRLLGSQPQRFSNLRIRTIQETAIATIACHELKALLEG